MASPYAWYGVCPECDRQIGLYPETHLLRKHKANGGEWCSGFSHDPVEGSISHARSTLEARGPCANCGQPRENRHRYCRLCQAAYMRGWRERGHLVSGVAHETSVA